MSTPAFSDKSFTKKKKKYIGNSKDLKFRICRVLTREFPMWQCSDQVIEISISQKFFFCIFFLPSCRGNHYSSFFFFSHHMVWLVLELHIMKYSEYMLCLVSLVQQKIRNLSMVMYAIFLLVQACPLLYHQTINCLSICHTVSSIWLIIKLQWTFVGKSFSHIFIFPKLFGAITRL